MFSPRGALLFVAKLFTLLFNKWAAHASDETEEGDNDSAHRLENPMFDEEEDEEEEDSLAGGQ